MTIYIRVNYARRGEVGQFFGNIVSIIIDEEYVKFTSQDADVRQSTVFPRRMVTMFRVY